MDNCEWRPASPIERIAAEIQNAPRGKRMIRDLADLVVSFIAVAERAERERLAARYQRWAQDATDETARAILSSVANDLTMGVEDNQPGTTP